ncbi:bifunctional 4-hydroxy-2-oxoglutarate aldolase/2-dehydro-3-deoxy-phosphogluconate aldolase [Streptomyces cyaneofuscatus]|uniref:bifunctional 4-hydroxy-2-oxoglutarate aldolase/2-dehydro-3-deoxy-phosphogluconate aldolase n=1 Tax=Streptomyces cyaneofuscatus TaxID=66883 RepID=UPI00343D0A7D
MSPDAAPLLSARILPVLTVPSVGMALPLAEALAGGGARCAEVTFRTWDAEQVVRAMSGHGGLVVGAGTVVTAEQAERAVAAGARFVVSPGFDAGVVAVCRQAGVPLVPGIATATELMTALRAGSPTVKLFPAEPLGGIRMIQALAAPFPQARFVPTGSVGPVQMPAYLAHPSVVAVGGSWMATPGHMHRGDWAEIRRLTAEAVERSVK